MNIHEVATRAMNGGWTIEINRFNPYILIEGPEAYQDYWYSGSMADALLTLADAKAKECGCEPHEYLLASVVPHKEGE